MPILDCYYIIGSIGFNMTSVFVGTGFSQVVQFQTGDKTKSRNVFGALARAPVRSISIDDANDRLIYATSKRIVAAYSAGEMQEVTAIKTEHSILKSEYIHPHAFVRYCLSNGSVHSVGVPDLTESAEEELNLHPETQFLGEKHNKFNCVAASNNRERYLFCGHGVVPVIANLATGTLDWYGKNVKNDELDLQVPIKDVDASFLGDQKAVVVLHADRKLRIYDVRGTQRRPVVDFLLPLTQKSQMTRMKIAADEHGYYFSNDIGEIFHCDNRNAWKVVGKYKGINASVNDFELTKKALFAASLDSYVHMYDLNTTKLIRKFYINKPAYCLRVFAQDEDSLSSCEGEQQEIALDDVEDEEPIKPEKLKQIRKRNKVGLKYLRPRQFDEPTEIKMEQVRHKEWYQDLNPIDRKEFEQ